MPIIASLACLDWHVERARESRTQQLLAEIDTAIERTHAGAAR